MKKQRCKKEMQGILLRGGNVGEWKITVEKNKGKPFIWFWLSPNKINAY
jgi:hypothetical protein